MIPKLGTQSKKEQKAQVAGHRFLTCDLSLATCNLHNLTLESGLNYKAKFSGFGLFPFVDTRIVLVVRFIVFFEVAAIIQRPFSDLNTAA